jgi:alpha-pyrone synthase
MSLAVLSIGTALPQTIISQHDALRVARSLCCRTDEHETWLPSMYGGTGINKRHLALSREIIADVMNGTTHSGSVFLPTGAPDDSGPTTGQRMQHYAELAPPLAVAASDEAVRRSGLDAAELTHLVTVSCTGFVAPGLDVALIRALDLRPTIQRTHVGYMGCHGALNGLRVARAFTGSDPDARVLLCAVELCSLHYHYGWNPSKMIANALFADGAAALVGVPGDAAPPEAWRVAATGSCLLPDSTDAMTWTIGDHGFEMALSKQVPGLIARHLRPWLEAWLSQHQVALSEVSSWAIHPGGPRILSAVEEGLNLSREAAAASRDVFAEYGNMSSPTLLFILDRLRRDQAKRPCVALGFGPGLMAEAALLM